MSVLIRRVGTKLADASGASMLFALLLLLVAVIVSCVMLSASVTSLKVVSTDRDHIQAQLALDSTARLAMEQLDGLQVRVAGDSDAPTFQLVGDSNPAGLRKLALDAFQLVYANQGAAYAADRPYVSQELSFAPADERLQKVTGVLRAYPKMESNLDAVDRSSYDMELDLTLTGQKGSYSETVLVSRTSASTGNGTTYQWTCQIAE